ncbi:MAG: GNAT family N-acetyltransferase, partial [Caulobacteraceae bacterium]
EHFMSGVMAHDPRRNAIFLIEHEHEGPVGMLGFHPSDGGLSEMGYWIGKPFWGRGFATEAAAGALHWASKDWSRRAIASGHFAGNAASANVLIKSGFLYTGEVQKRHCLASGRTERTRMMVWLA